jgi:hypothetical protein
VIKSCSRCRAWNGFNCLLGYEVVVLPKEQWVYWKTDILNGFYVKIKPKSNCEKPLTFKKFLLLYKYKTQ